MGSVDKMELNNCIRVVHERLLSFVNHEKLFDAKSRLLVGLSGGADSVMLLDWLLRAGFRCCAVHCNFHLRGEESDGDEQFVTRFCQSNRVKLHVEHFDTVGEAKRRAISIEMAARNLRYDFFEQYRYQNNLTHVVVAHHRDDSIETLLLNLIRGSGIRGLTGISPSNGYVVRPLLCLSRDEIIAYLKARNLTFVTDSSNADDRFRRNKIRLQLLPLLEEMNPSVRETLAHTTHYLADVCSIYESSVEQFKARCFTTQGNDVMISIEELLKLPAPESLLYEMLRPFHFSSSVIKELFQSAGTLSGKQFLSPTHRVVKDRRCWIVSPLAASSSLMLSFSIDSSQPIEPQGLRWQLVESVSSFQIPHSPTKACFDLEKLGTCWHIRPWQKGDWFLPFGMKGRKKVSDYFVDRKYSLLEKERARLLCTASGEVAWIVGERIDGRFAVDQTTRRIVVFETTSGRVDQ